MLTALLIFTIIPETKKANNLIDQVCQAISLDLNSGTATSGSQLPQDQIVDYALTADDVHLPSIFAPSEVAIHIILFVAYHFHSTKRVIGYKTYGEDLSAKKNVILADITDIIGRLHNGTVQHR